MSTYPCVKCGRTVNITNWTGATDFYEYKGMYFCSTSCMSAWKAENENSSSSGSSSGGGGGGDGLSSAIDGVGAAVGGVGKAVGGIFTGIGAIGSGMKTGVNILKRNSDAKFEEKKDSKARAKEIGSMTFGETAKEIETQISELMAEYETIPPLYVNAYNYPLRAARSALRNAIKDKVELGILKLRQAGDNATADFLEKKFKKNSSLFAQIFKK